MGNRFVCGEISEELVSFEMSYLGFLYSEINMKYPSDYSNLSSTKQLTPSVVLRTYQRKFDFHILRG